MPPGLSTILPAHCPICCDTVQNRVEIDGFEDGPPGGMDVAQRLEALRRRRMAWATMQFTTREVISQRDQGHLVVYSGRSIILHGETQLCIKQFPSAYRGGSPREWRVDILDTMLDLAVDWSQDLLVIFEKRECTPEDPPYFRLLAASTGQGHPTALQPQLPIPALRSFDMEGEIRNGVIVAGEYVGIQVEEGTERLLVYNWKSSVLVLDTEGYVAFGYTFLAEHYLLLVHPDEEGSTLRISVIDLRKQLDTPEVNLFDLHMACQLLLPEFTSGAPYQVNTQQLGVQSRRSNIPFVAKNHLVKIELLYNEEEAALLIPESTILRYLQSVDSSERIVSWEEWSRYGCRLFNTLDLDFSPNTNGMSAIVSDGFPAPTITLYDFSPIGVRKYLHDVKAGTAAPGMTYSKSSEYIQYIDPGDESRLLTTLPARCVEIPPEHLPHPIYGNNPLDIILSDDMITLFYRLDDGSQEYHVLTF
ncbi:hypothetical protein BXZ70DRAFT_703436 [Cristinia sonorae]|uniref:Uncharacterized protein n=1 Tax=Cristinia sonorae TaxID=1940300 RepID=A0A8K0XK17_9AGAR|nr:hypothetical protein BXZ70DRAFT_703436 [Cristinia sonorae]